MKKAQMIERLAHVAAVIEGLGVDEIKSVEITWINPRGCITIEPDALRAIVHDYSAVRHTLSAITLEGTVEGVRVLAYEVKALPRGV